MLPTITERAEERPLAVDMSTICDKFFLMTPNISSLSIKSIFLLCSQQNQQFTGDVESGVKSLIFLLCQNMSHFAANFFALPEVVSTVLVSALFFNDLYSFFKQES